MHTHRTLNAHKLYLRVTHIVPSLHTHHTFNANQGPLRNARCSSRFFDADGRETASSIVVSSESLNRWLSRALHKTERERHSVVKALRKCKRHNVAKAWQKARHKTNINEM